MGSTPSVSTARSRSAKAMAVSSRATASWLPKSTSARRSRCSITSAVTRPFPWRGRRVKQAVGHGCGLLRLRSRFTTRADTPPPPSLYLMICLGSEAPAPAHPGPKDQPRSPRPHFSSTRPPYRAPRKPSDLPKNDDISAPPLSPP